MSETDIQKQSLRSRGICVIIPTYNNAGTIASVTERALAQCLDVIVVCDGCTDGTVGILENLPGGPVLVELKKNSGKGTALKEGFRKALEMGFAYAITLDGDGQHFPEDIPLMLEANRKHPGALIVGQRKYLKDMPRSKGSKFANSFSNFWFAVQTGHYLADTQTGYRLYPLKKLHGLSLLTSRYEGFGMCLVEALQMQVPCISFDIKIGPSEIIANHQNGILIPPFDCEQMIQKINHLIENPDKLEGLSENTMIGFERYQDEYIKEKWKNIFNKLS